MNIYLILTTLMCCSFIKIFLQNQNLINVTNLQNKLQEKITPLMIKLGYNCLYTFSLCNIQLNKLKNQINSPIIALWSYLIKYLKENKILVEKMKIVLIDDNGNEIKKIMSNKSNIEFIKLECEEYNYSGLILMDNYVETTCINSVFYTTFPKTFDYKISNISFMSIELEYENKAHVINLKNNKYNYYIVNNCLNQQFWKYYIKNILKTQINEDNFDYKLTIIDDNVNIITLLPNQYIIIMENDYKIHCLTNSNSIRDACSNVKK